MRKWLGISYITVKYRIVSALFFKEVTILLKMELRWINSVPPSTPLMLQDRLLNHRIVSFLLFGRWSYREWTSVFFIDRIRAANTVQLLFEYFRQECSFNKSAFRYFVLLLIWITFMFWEGCSEANLLVGSRRVVVWTTLTFVISILILLLDGCSLLLFILHGDEIE